MVAPFPNSHIIQSKTFNKEEHRIQKRIKEQRKREGREKQNEDIALGYDITLGVSRIISFRTKI